MEVDRPEVVAQVTEMFEAYERALMANDVEAMLGFFADRAVRFGIADQQTGLAEQRRWRLAQSPLPPGRHLKETEVRTYGRDAATVTTLFGYAGSDTLGRQSQTWIRGAGGWRIVHAHVSEPRPETGP